MGMKRPWVTILTAHQLLPEHAEAISAAGRVIFLDATAVGLPALALLPLLVLVLAALRRHERRGPAEPDYVAQLAAPVSRTAVVLVLLIIPAALAAFAFSEAVGLSPAVPYAIFAVTVGGGFGLFLLSLWRVWREGG